MVKSCARIVLALATALMLGGGSGALLSTTLAQDATPGAVSAPQDLLLPAEMET